MRKGVRRNILTFLVLATVAIIFCRTGNAADVCSPNTFAKVSGNRPVLGVFLGDAAKTFIQKLDSRQSHTWDWANTKVKVVAGSKPGYVHILVIENNCVVSTISRTNETYQAALPKP